MAMERFFRAGAVRALWFIAVTLMMLATSSGGYRVGDDPRHITDRISCPSSLIASSQSIVFSESVECPQLVLLGLTRNPAEDAPSGEAKAIMMLPYFDRAVWESRGGARQELIASEIFRTRMTADTHLELHAVQLPAENLSDAGESPLHIKAVRVARAYHYDLQLNASGTDLVQASSFTVSLADRVIVIFFRPSPMSDADAKSQINIPDSYSSLVSVEGEGRLVIADITGLTPSEVRADFANGLPRLSIQAASP